MALSRNDVKTALQSLASKQLIFRNKQDFTDKLTYEILQLPHPISICHPFNYLQCTGTQNISPNPMKNSYDIVTYDGCEYSVIELEYKTSIIGTQYPQNSYKGIQPQNMRHENFGRYDFMRKIEFLEGIVSLPPNLPPNPQYFNSRNKYVILLTNDPLYWDKGLNTKYANAKDVDFRIYDTRSIPAGQYTWRDNAGNPVTKPNYPSLVLWNKLYTIRWDDYLDINTPWSGYINTLFRYTIVEVY